MAQKGGNGDAGQRVKFHYLKGSLFRVIHADGAMGGITPRGNIHMAFYSERAAIPREHVHRLDASGRLGERIDEETVSREGIVREMDVDVIMSIADATGLRDWLTQQIESVRTLKQQESSQ